MIYRYRCYYALLIMTSIMSLAYFYHLQAEWQQYTELCALENELTKTIVLMKSYAQHVNTSSSDAESSVASLLAGVLAAVQKSGLILHSFVEADVGKVVAEGGFQQWAVFVASLARQGRPLAVTEFAAKLTDQHTLKLSMDVLAAMQPLSGAKMNLDALKMLQNPFCSFPSMANQALLNDAVKRQQVLLDQIRLVGYLHQGQRSQAVVVFPDGSLQALSSGDVLGKEKAVITDIQPDKLVLVLPSSQRYELKK